MILFLTLTFAAMLIVFGIDASQKRRDFRVKR